MTLTKETLIELIHNKIGYPMKESKQILELILEEMKTALENGEDVKISSFGKWSVRQKNSRPGRNPHTGEPIAISARKVVTFHPSEKLRKVVNKARSAEEDPAAAPTSEF